MEYGYARVSTREQNLDRQIAALMDAGVAERKIFSAMLYLTKELTSREAAAGCGLCQSTFLRRVKKNKNNLKTENKNVEFLNRV